MAEWIKAAESGDVKGILRLLKSSGIHSSVGQIQESSWINKAMISGDPKLIVAAALASASKNVVAATNSAWRTLIDAGEDPQDVRVIASAIIGVGSITHYEKLPPFHIKMIREETGDLQGGLKLHEVLFPKGQSQRDRVMRKMKENTDRKVMHDPINGKHIIFLSGLPGAGKSTWVNTQSLPVFGYDQVREREKKYVWNEQNEARTRERAVFEMMEFMNANDDAVAIWDSTTLSYESRARNKKMATGIGAQVTFVSLDVPKSLAIERNAGRNSKKKVPDHKMQDFAGKREMIWAGEAHNLISVDSQGLMCVVKGKAPSSQLVGELDLAS